MKTETNPEIQTPALPPSVLTRSQVKTYGPRPCPSWGEGYMIRARVRHDDRCGNGHNTFSITADIYGPRDPDAGGGCCHKEIAAAFPELAPFIKWHLVSTDGPMHYVANVVYLAGDRDCHGLRKGEFRQHISRGPHQNNGVAGVPCWELRISGIPEDRQDRYSVEKPAAPVVVAEWVPYGCTGEGKARELDAARRTAVWPEATDAELMQEPPALTAALLARLPALMEAFKRDVESLGFVY